MNSSTPEDEDAWKLPSGSSHRSPTHGLHVARNKRGSQRVSCAECRRRKLKCDREVPCNNCQKSGCADKCPNGTRKPRYALLTEGDPTIPLRNRIQLLEDTLFQHGIPIPGDTEDTRMMDDVKSEASYSTGAAAFPTPVIPTPPQPQPPTPFYPEAGPGPSTYGYRPQAGYHPARVDAWNRRTVVPESMARREGAAPDTDRGRTDSDDEDWKPSYGTLVLGNAGRSRYVGATAASEWLNKTLDTSETPALRSNASDYEAQPSSARSGFNLNHAAGNFPPLSGATSPSYQWLRAQLPSRETATSLVSFYYRHYSWNYNVIERKSFGQIFEAFYGLQSSPIAQHGNHWTPDTHPHKLALMYIILAMGNYFNFETGDRVDMAVSDRYFKLCTHCLAISNFLSNNTLPSLQTLHILVNYQLYVDRLDGADLSWPVWGMAMRIAQAMGLHRDPSRWEGLPEQAMDDRRRIFWETRQEDVLQASCWGRPGGIARHHFDTAFPKELEGPPGSTDPNAIGYSTMKYLLSSISNEVLDQVMTVKPPTYSDVSALYKKIMEFESTVPFFLRCRPAMLANLTAFPDPNDALTHSPAPNITELRISFQQHGLALNISETAFFLQRPFFARALHDSPLDPSKSRFGESYLALVERCNMIIAIATSIHALYPQVARRQWFFQYHASSAAACMASLSIAAPRSPLALLGITQLQATCDLFSTLTDHSHQNEISYMLLNNLKQTAFNSVYGPTGPYSGSSKTQTQMSPGSSEREKAVVDERSSFLIGLHTRLINKQSELRARAMIPRIEHPTPSTTMHRMSLGMDGLHHQSGERAVLDLNGLPDGQAFEITQNAVGMLAPVWQTAQSDVVYDSASASASADFSSLAKIFGVPNLNSYPGNANYNYNQGQM